VGNVEWAEKFPNFRVVNGDPRHSDHRPVIVDLEAEHGSSGGEYKFRFEASWMHEAECSKIIENAWKESVEEGSQKVAEAMKRVAGSLESWSREVVGDLEKKLKKTRKELESCRRRDVSEEKVEEEARLRGELEALEEMKNTKWKQRAHVWWLKDGDRNTKFFHSFASERKKRNKIKELEKENGEVVKEDRDLTNYILSHFQDLFRSAAGGRLAEMMRVVQPRVTSAMNESLTAEFTAAEVKMALDSIGDLKAPGPDGMP
jgi:hypothetical protein